MPRVLSKFTRVVKGRARTNNNNNNYDLVPANLMSVIMLNNIISFILYINPVR